MSNDTADYYTKKDAIYGAGIFVGSLILMYQVTLIFNKLRTGEWDLTSIYSSLTPEAMTFFGIFFLSPIFFMALYYFGNAVYDGFLFMISLTIGSKD